MNKFKPIPDKIADTQALLVKYRKLKKEREENIITTTFEKIIDEINSLLRRYLDNPHQTNGLNLKIETPLLENKLHLAEIVKSKCHQHLNITNITIQNDGAVINIFIKNG